MQRNVDAVLEQREKTGQPMFPHINHPNFRWAVKVEDLIALRGERFFEVYNGHPEVRNEGDADHPGTERMWDILLAERLSEGEEVMYGLATDDAHAYHEFGLGHVNPGRGWVMVRAESLSAEALIRAMEAGDFYGSSGVTLDAIEASDEGLSVTIHAEPGVEYRTRVHRHAPGVRPRPGRRSRSRTSTAPRSSIATATRSERCWPRSPAPRRATPSPATRSTSAPGSSRRP